MINQNITFHLSKYKGQGRGGGRKFYPGAELVKCIDPNEGEALRRGSTFKHKGAGTSCIPVPPPMGAGGREEGREVGGREDIGYN